MDNIIDIELTGRSTRRDQKLWQYDYGQVLRIAGKEFPKVTEVQFSLQQSGGHTLDRIGTSNNGLLTVQIPNELLQNKGTTSDYTIYAFVYLSGDGSGNTKYMIQLPVESRPEPTDPSEDPTIDPSIFKDAINSVNASAERAETAEKSAKESANKAKEYADSAGKSKGDVEKARDNAISAIGIEKESALRGIESKTVESLQKIQSQTEASQNGINQSIENATEKKSELDGAVGKATEAKKDLENGVQSAKNTNVMLDSSVQSAGEQKSTLDATIEQANTIDTSLKEHIGSAEQIQENIEQIRKNKADISSLNEDLEEVKDKKITKFYASNQGETHLADSDNGKIMDMMLYGRSEQFSTTGAQLFNENNEIKSRGVIIKINGSTVTFDGIVSDEANSRVNYQKKIKLKPGKYTASSSNKKILADFTEVKANGETIYTNPIEIDGTEKEVKIRVLFGLRPSAKGDVINETTNIMLNEGDKALPYEPYTGGKPSPSPDYPQEIKSVVNPTVKVTNEDGLKVQSVTLNNITLNAIPVSSDGNVTIDGQQYIADYVDVERGKVVRKIGKLILTGEENWMLGFENWTTYPHAFRAEELKKDILKGNTMNEKYTWYQKQANLDLNSMNAPYNRCIAVSDARFSSVNEFTNELKKQDSNGTPLTVYYVTDTPQEENLSLEEIEFLKSLSTYYPVTNISVNSEQLDGYTVFNYPISMANGWNYVKQQLNDNRDYIYDMDIQSAEAYVNSEYAVALTELEV